MLRQRIVLAVLQWSMLVACSGGDKPSGGLDGTGAMASTSSGEPFGSSKGGATSSTTRAGTSVGGTKSTANEGGKGGVSHSDDNGSSGVPGGTSNSGAASRSSTATSSRGGNTTNQGGAAAGGVDTKTSGNSLIGGGSSGKGGTAANGGASANGGSANGGGGSTSVTEMERVDIADVWSGHPVAFALVTRAERQFVAYYDDQRRMTVAARTLGTDTWTYQVLDSTLGWDSHNYVAMALDASDQLHVSGNMHGVPLVYYRSTTPLDVKSLTKLNRMVGADEAQVTYPVFFDGPSGDLIFEYRSGSSGSGNTIFNTYSTSARTWTRTLNTALLDGSSSDMNAYPEGPVLGPDGYFHLVWVWRNTPDASTNHDLSYAKTQDLVHWFKGDGTAITLPIKPTTGDIVDAVPVNGGMINNNTRIGFDAEKRPIIAYHKFDGQGNTQLYEARLESGKWAIHQATDWTYRWAFGGNGTLVFDIIIDEGPKLHTDGTLIQNFYHAKLGGQGTLVLNPTTLHADSTKNPPLRPYPLALDSAESTYRDPVNQDAMVVRWAEDSGNGSDASVRYLLRWETLPSNADKERANVPPATKLRLYGFR